MSLTSYFFRGTESQDGAQVFIYWHNDLSFDDYDEKINIFHFEMKFFLFQSESKAQFFLVPIFESFFLREFPDFYNFWLLIFFFLEFPSIGHCEKNLIYDSQMANGYVAKHSIF